MRQGGNVSHPAAMCSVPVGHVVSVVMMVMVVVPPEVPVVVMVMVMVVEGPEEPVVMVMMVVVVLCLLDGRLALGGGL